MANGTEEIPGPTGLPFLGNIGTVDSEVPLTSFLNLADQYGPIYRLNFAGNPVVFCSSWELINELCDEKRFAKSIKSALKEVRNAVHDGLFTAKMDEPNWGIAHRVLMPAFGPLSIAGMLDEMHDIASQLAMKWARHGSSVPIMVTEDFTRLTLDTLALCAMGYRFNSFYHDEMHPFIEAMGSFLTESGSRFRRPPITSMFYRDSTHKYFEDIDLMRKTADEVLKARKENPTDRNKDLLTAMLNGTDPKTGQKMTDSSIIDNLITFLIAGHETTSGLLSFAFYQLLKHPEAYRKAQDEVDEVVGTGPVKIEHLGQLKYIAAVLRETLRHSPTISQFSVAPIQDEIIGGRYKVPKDQPIVLLLAKSQMDTTVYGKDADQFVPERMLDENFDKLNKEFPNCWKPFGNGARACIGRPFAWQEALLVTAMLLQNFNFLMDDPSYQLHIKQTLTIKPKGFYMRCSLREGLTATTLEHRLSGSEPRMDAHNAGVPVAGAAAKNGNGRPFSIYFGSNSGTCQGLANRLAQDAPSHGFAARVVDPLDAAYRDVPSNEPVAIITASYEGQPPDNAGLFVNWITSLKAHEMEKVSYAVFGCGHHDWFETFHRIPKLIDSMLDELGGNRIAQIGLSDAAKGEIFTDFETWEDEVFWPAMSEKYGIKQSAEAEAVPALSVEFSTPRTSSLRQDVREACIVDVKTLSAPGQPLKKHLEIKLPTDMAYRAGDYLVVLPLNPKQNVIRAMRRFQIPWDAHMRIRSDGRTNLPINESLSVDDVLGAYVELGQPATKRSILSLAEATKGTQVKETLQNLAGNDYAAEISAKRVSLLELLERFPEIELPFGTFLSLLPPMRVRQYSISSSPLWNPLHVTLTFSILESPSLSGTEHRYIGVASNFLANLGVGDRLHVSVRPSHTAFHLPLDAAHTPIVCIAAGTGIAPFRGFIQERAAMIGAGRSLAPCLLFFGCRDPDADELYRDDMDRWQAMGAVDMRFAYSRRADHPDAAGCKYVQHRLYHDRNDVGRLWEKGARLYVCGSRDVGEGVHQAAIKMMAGFAKEHDGQEMSEVEVEKWFQGLRNVRYATDVFD
ncbi:cytochrome P450 [Lipomyces orientalis]|uniref:Cytochrome P450 n=1 Tax=Lipomyces orientalis TaxID=1233043 RepID=A0ACC3TJG0_9ASCO